MEVFLLVFSLIGLQISSDNVFFPLRTKKCAAKFTGTTQTFFLSCKLTTRYLHILTNTGKLTCKMTVVLLKMYLLFTNTTKLCFNLFSTNLLSALFSMVEEVEFRLNKTMH